MKNLLRIFSLVLVLVVFSGCGINLQWTKKNVPVVKPVEVRPEEKKMDDVRSIKDRLAAESQIYKFKDLSELKTFIDENVTSSGMGVYGNEMQTLAMPMVKREGAPVPMMATADMAMGGGGSEDFSHTNIQVEGVDEADIIKNDGKYIYALVGMDLYFIQAYPVNDATVLSKISFKSRPDDIYINGDRLIVYGSDTILYESELARSFRRHSPYTFFKIFDISDRKNPKQITDLNFEGSYFSSRMVGDYVYFITQNYSYGFIEGEPLLPRIIENDAMLSSDCGASRHCFVPDVYYFDMPYESVNFVNVYAINIMDASEPLSGNVYLTNSANELYASEKNIYLSYTKYINEYEVRTEVVRELVYPRLPKADKEKIAKIESADKDLLNKDEKRRKVDLVIENFIISLALDEQKDLDDKIMEAIKSKYTDIANDLQTTVIHKISYDKSSLGYLGFGEVRGRVLNQFSMDESNGYFRVATTKDQSWSQYIENTESVSNLYVLDESMKQIGAVEDLAPGEQIYSVRFMQNRAYLVTFEQVDPLFVIDLEDPKSPKILGKLKIPGFSSYLHPYDDNLLIGLGKDTEEQKYITVGGDNRANESSVVQIKGVKLSLFDVSDPSTPKEVDTYVMGDEGSDSIAISDHKAFLFSKEKELLSIPVTLRESKGNSGYGQLSFGGAAVFKVTKNGFELLGKIDHSDGGKVSPEDWWGGYQYYDNTVKRSLYIDNVLYTFSNKYLKMNQLSDMTELKTIEIKKDRAGSGSDFDVIN